MGSVGAIEKSATGISQESRTFGSSINNVTLPSINLIMKWFYLAPKWGVFFYGGLGYLVLTWCMKKNISKD